jgi:hypothetical protein
MNYVLSGEMVLGDGHRQIYVGKAEEHILVIEYDFHGVMA